MIQDNLLLVLLLLFAVSMIALLSEKLRISYPIFLVISGLIISFIPGTPMIKMDPDLVFTIFLPPLLYSAAWYTAWGEFWRLRRPIGTLAFGLVIITAVVVALVSTWLIPGLTLAAGFLLGGVVSPPDAVAAASVFEQLKVPRRVTTVLEGESLINDASSLIVFRFALIAMATGRFVFWDAAGSFLLVVSMGILIGLAIGQIICYIHRYMPTTASIDTALTLMTPYLIYLTAEHFHFSGVLAVVSGGLLLSYRSADAFGYNSRLQAINVWSTWVFLLNGIVFMMIGLQLPSIMHGLGSESLMDSIWFGLIISLVIVAVRLLWVFPAAFIQRLISPKGTKRENKLNWKAVFIIGWSGMRGVVSLASALAIPLTLANGAAFPHRSLILFITFIVILFTLIVQGLSLPLIMRWLKMEVHENDAQQEYEIRYKLAKAVLDYLDNSCPAEIAAHAVFVRVKEKYERMAENANKGLAKDEETSPAFMKTYRAMLLEIINIRRQILKGMHINDEYADHLIRAKERELDLEEARTRRT